MGSTGEIRHSCFDFLMMEMVDYVIKSAGNGEGGNGSAANTQVYEKLENLGFRVGQGMVERVAKDKQRLQTSLECIKFLCKDFWNTLYNKSIDNLRTNHKGVFVLTDKHFHWLSHVGASPELAANYITFPCGIIRGALDNLGIACSVTADISAVPTCVFTIKTQ
ncbi:Trafficking protein particle complex subunit 6B [Balamuthia mandrillaris]